MRRDINITVAESESGLTVKSILKGKLQISGKLLGKIKRDEGRLLLNGIPVYVNARVEADDRIYVMLEDDGSHSKGIVPCEGRLDIRYENQDIMIVNKPPNIAVHSSHGNFENTLASIIAYYFANRGESFTYRPINRLDKGVSGLMAVAKNSYTHTYCAKQLHNGMFIREYLAVVEGVLERDEGTVTLPIRRKPGSVLMREVSEEGEFALTRFWTVKRVDSKSLVRIRLETGRTHQIRVHMSHMGHPITNDFLYGNETHELKNRLALHSCYLFLRLPFGEGDLELKSELPADIANLL